jgi:hypothetical protein
VTGAYQDVLGKTERPLGEPQSCRVILTTKGGRIPYGGNLFHDLPVASGNRQFLTVFKKTRKKHLSSLYRTLVEIPLLARMGSA